MEGAPSFDLFLAQLYKDYEMAPDHEVSITYKDSDGDTIHVKSQMEWEELLSQHSQTSIIKLSVRQGERVIKEPPKDVMEVVREVKTTPKETSATPQPAAPHLPFGLSDLGGLFPGAGGMVSNLLSSLGGVIDPSYLDKEKLGEFLNNNIKTPAQVALEKARQAIDKMKLEKAEELLNSISLSDPSNPEAYYLRACLESLRNNVEVALTALETALALGYSQFSLVLSDPNLENLRKSAKFTTLVNNLGLANKKNKWDEQLNILHDMGYTDDHLLISHLERTKGNIAETVSAIEDIPLWQ